MRPASWLLLAVACTSDDPVDSGKNGDSGEPVDIVVPSPVVYFAFDACPAVDVMGTGLEATPQLDAACGDADGLSDAIGGTWSSGTSLVCDGDQDHARVEHDALLAPETWTLAAWVIVDGDCSDHLCTVVSKANSDDESKGYWLSVNGGVALAGYADGLETELFGPTQVASGVWHHVAATFDGDVGRVYLDGVYEAGSAIPHGVTYGEEPWLVGAMNGRLGRYDFPGRIDEVKLWDEALDAAQVAEVFATYTD
jgi:hypothetical protein